MKTGKEKKSQAGRARGQLQQSYNQILCMTQKKTYPLVIQTPTIPLGKGGKRRIRLMQNNEPI
ncbi:MAG: hypothetical protein KBB67_13875, partial [Syntrophorhabdus sp.]|nr:hypothetical protein [Syntrophorhabdus sp.]